MKKSILCGIALVAGLLSCTEDYTDWASPQANAAKEAAQRLELAIQPTISSIDFATYKEEVVQLFTTNLTEAQADAYALAVTGDGADDAVIVAADAAGRVETADLIEAVMTLYGANPVERTLSIAVGTIATNTTADGDVKVQRKAGPFTLKAKLDAPYIDAGGYYLVGNIDGWTCTRVEAFHMVNNGGDAYDNPEFAVTIDAVSGISTYEIKMIPAADFNADGTVKDWGRAFSQLPGVDIASNEGALSNSNSGGNIKFDAVEDAAQYTITVNAMTSTYTVEVVMAGDQSKFDTDPILFLTGSNYSWGGTWLPMVPVYGDGNTLSWRMIYLHEGEEFKFAPQQGWGNDFGYNVEAVVDEAGMNPIESGTNIKVGKSGWYIILVDNTAGARKVTFLKPEVYLIGNTAAAGWDVAESGLFTVPDSESGKFVSPAFAKDDEVRMCVKLPDIDWWKTEFVVTAEGTLDYRAGGGDQARVKVGAGQKCYLSFANGTGSYK
jgi:hypothetical protein